MIFIAIAALLATLGFLVYLTLESQKQNKAFRSELEEMNKEFKRRGAEVSKELERINSTFEQSSLGLDLSQHAVTEFEEKLQKLFASLSATAGQFPDLVTLQNKLSETKETLIRTSVDLTAASAKARDLETSHDAAAMRVKELEVALLEIQKREGVAPVAANRISIQEAVDRAAELSGQNGSSAEAKLAKKTAQEEGEAIMRAFDAATLGDTEGAASLVDASPFDPFKFHPNLWDGTIAAKRTLEATKAAALTALVPHGFRVDRPRVQIDLYDKEKHDLRDSIPTTKEELKGKIAELRRPGLIYKDKIVRPARVVQYAIDYARTGESEPTPVPIPVTVTATPSTTPEPVEAIRPPTETPTPQPSEESATKLTEKKRGISDF